MGTSLAAPLRVVRESLAQLSAFNLGYQFVWGAVLALSLQTRSSDLGGVNGVADYSTIAAIGAAIGAVVQVAAGIAADRRRAVVGHRREFTWFGTIFTIPALVWFYLAPNFGQLIAAFAALEIFINIATGPYSAVIPDYVPLARRGLASSFMSAFSSLGNAAGLVLIVALTGLVHAHVDLIVACSLSAGLLGTAVVTLSHARRLDAIPVPGTTVAITGGPSGSFSSPLARLLYSRGLINIGFYTLLGFLLFYVRDALGVGGTATQTQTGLIFLTFTFAAIAGAALAAGPSDRYDKRLVVSVAIGVVVIALAGLAIASSLPVAFAMGGLAGVGWGAFVTADWALAAIVLPAAEMGAAMGVWNIGTAVPQIIAPIITLPIVLHFNARQAGLGTRGAIALSLVEFAIGGALIWKLPKA